MTFLRQVICRDILVIILPMAVTWLDVESVFAIH